MAIRTAKCVCGQLSVDVEGEPSGVYACSCKKCQRGSGSAFSYAAQFKTTALKVSGDHKAYRDTGESGNWTEGHFCPTCGATVFPLFQHMTDEAIVSAGCFEDSSFAPPQILFWASRKHEWLKVPDDTTLLETQPG